jgi:hypothetical protein
VASKSDADCIVPSQVGRSSREAGMEGVIRVDKSNSEVDECRPARKVVRASEAAMIGGKAVDWMKVKTVDKSASISFGARSEEGTRLSVDDVSLESCFRECVPVNIGPTKSFRIRVWRLRIGSARACRRERAMYICSRL